MENQPAVLTGADGIEIAWQPAVPMVLYQQPSAADPDFTWRRAAGFPAVPVRIVYVGVPFGCGLELEVIEAQRELLELDGLQVTPPSEVTAMDEADSGIAGGWFPGQPARLLSTGVVRSQRIAAIELAPYHVRQDSSFSAYYPHIRVRLTFTGEPERWPNPFVDGYEHVFASLLANAAESAMWRRPPAAVRGAPLPNLAPRPEEIAWKFEVEDYGIVRITAAEADLTGIELSQLRMRAQTRPVFMRLSEDGNGEFDGDDYIEFVGKPYFLRDGSKSQFTDRNVYWLELTTSTQTRMHEEIAAPGGQPVPQRFLQTLHFEENLVVHWPEDKFFWQLIYAGETKRYELQIPDISVAGGGQAQIRVRLFGYTTLTSVSPDHHVTLSFNGRDLGAVKWDADTPYEFVADVPIEWLNEGANQLGITVVNDPNIPLDAVLLNWIELDYWRQYRAVDNALIFTAPEEGPGAYTYEIHGFSTDDIDVFDMSNQSRLIDVQVVTDGAEYTARFSQTSTADSTYIALTNAARMAPSSSKRDTPSSWTSPNNAADMIIISHGSFVQALQPLVDFHEARGRRVLVVDIEDIFDELSQGIFEPSAIKSFVRYAYESYASPSPTDVLLVGDASWDYKGFLPEGIKQNYVPSYGKNWYGKSATRRFAQEVRDLNTQASIGMPAEYDFLYGEAMVDNQFVAVSGNDDLPDLNIGRWCAETPQDVSIEIQKRTQLYERMPHGPWHRNSMFITGGVGDDEQEIFRQQTDNLINDGLHPERTKLNIIRIEKTTDDYNWGEYEDEIARHINEGVGMINFSGHAGSWSWEAMFDFTDLARLDNNGRLPFVASMTCNTVRFANAAMDSFGEEFQMRPDPADGSSAFWGGCNFGGLWADFYLAYRFYQEVFTNHILNIGDSITAGKVRTLLAYPSYAIIIEPYTLLGDPTMDFKFDSHPAVALAGYWDTRISQSQGGQLTFLAWALGLEGVDVKDVEIFFGGLPTSVYLQDNGQSGDFGAGDTVFGLSLPIGPNVIPVNQYLIELKAHDHLGSTSRIWPQLEVPEH